MRNGTRVKKTTSGRTYLVDGKVVFLLPSKTSSFDPKQFLNITRMVMKNKCPKMD